MAAHRRPSLIALLLFLALALLSPRCAAARPSPTPSSNSGDHPLFNIVPIAVGIVVFLAVLFCLLLISSLLFPCLVRLYRRNRRQSHSVSGDVAASFDDVDVWERPGMSAKQMEKIPERLYSAEVKEVLLGKGAAECAVCLCEFEDHDRLRLLPGCSHAFHRDCIDTWLASHFTCPTCRADILAALPAASENEEGGTAAGHSDEVVVVVDPALVAAEEESKRRKEVHDLLDLGRRIRQSMPRVVAGRQPPPEHPCTPSRSEFVVIDVDEFRLPSLSTAGELQHLR